MSAASGAAGEERARRLLRWYPRAWRARYGEEFAALLLADIEERPGCARRTLDVARAGLAARFGAAGLAPSHLDAPDQVRTSLAWLGVLAALFAAFGLAMWSQLTIGWQWSPPDTTATVVAVVVMSGAVLALASLAVVAATPLAVGLVAGLRDRPQRRRLAMPAGALAASTAYLVAGGRHFGNGWPGTGGHPWAHQGLVPGGVAAFSWASTLSVTAYWAHPAALSHFPAAELGWMATSPLAIGVAVVSLVKLVRRVSLSQAVLRFEARLGAAACAAMAVFVGGAGCWLFEGGPGPRDLYRAGAVDAAGVAVLGASVALAARVVRLALEASGRVADGRPA